MDQRRTTSLLLSDVSGMIIAWVRWAPFYEIWPGYVHRSHMRKIFDPNPNVGRHFVTQNTYIHKKRLTATANTVVILI